MNMAEYAMRVNFTAPRAKPIEPKIDVAVAIEPFTETAQGPERIPREAIRLGLRVRGHGGGDWTVVVNGDEISSADVGLHPACAAVAECQVETFGTLVGEPAAIEAALISGNLEMKGDPSARPFIVAALRQLGASGRTRALAASGPARALASN
jgi:hypothetical protein